MKRQPNTIPQGALFQAGFTLIEMVVAVSLLVIVILGVGVVFKGATDAVGVSEKTLEILSNVRSVQAQIEHDVSGMDKSCFLAIRGGQYSYQDSTGNTTTNRCDLVSFISYGSFAHRTGASPNGLGTPFTDDHPVAPSAFITYGQLALAKTGGTNGSLTDPTQYLDASNQTYQVQATQVPTGVVMTPNGPNEGGVTLGRNAILLFPKSVTSSNEIAINTTSLEIGAFPNNGSMCPIDYSVGPADDQGDSVGSNITQSRVDAAAATPSQIMNFVRLALGSPRSDPLYEANHFCYRHAAICSPYDGLGGNIVNGYFRMYPIALPGVSSFIVEWSDGVTLNPQGTTDPVTGADISGTTEWFGLGNPDQNYTSWSNGNPGQTSSGTSYSAVFSYDTTRTKWPVALRFRFHVADPTGRLAGGRDFTQVVRLPY